MTGRNPDTHAERGAVTDPDHFAGWEEELRAGMEAEGESGSVEPELAVLRMMLHARAPAELTAAREDAIWSAIDREATPLPWWKRLRLVWIAPVAAAAAAVLVVVLVQPTQQPTDGTTIAGVDRKAMAEQLEGQFAMLAPNARANVARKVDVSRSNMRGQLIAMAQTTAGSKDDGTHGGAP
jgi:hypothetical protein